MEKVKFKHKPIKNMNDLFRRLHMIGAKCICVDKKNVSPLKPCETRHFSRGKLYSIVWSGTATLKIIREAENLIGQITF